MRSKANQWMVCGWFLLALFFSFVVMLTGCYQQFVRDPLYDQSLIEPSPSDSATYFRISVQNNRTEDPVDPHFYLVGTGSHALGIVQGFGSTVTRFVDTAWLGPDGCFTIVAHYVGEGDWTSPKVCWNKGEWVDVKLQNLIATSSAWSHR